METDSEKLALLVWRLCDVCLVGRKSGRKSICRGRSRTGTAVRTNIRDRYHVVIDDRGVEDALEANIPLGKAALAAAIKVSRSHQL